MSSERASPVIYNRTTEERKVKTEIERMGVGGGVNSCPYTSSTLYHYANALIHTHTHTHVRKQ